jgi:hypothetical protein
MKMALRSSAFALAIVVQAAAPKPFKIIEAGIHQTEDGPLSPTGTVFVPGEVIFFSCRLDGYAVSSDKKVAIGYEFSAVDPGGVPIVEPVSGKIDAELSPQDKEWKPKIRHTALIPPLAQSGIYKVRISVKDELSGGAATAESAFEVRGRAVEPSETLVVRNFSFHRTEDDGEPLKIAAYRPGDAVWARFDITGYKLGEGNQREVSYTVNVTRADGKVLLAPREPSVDKGASFYPMRYAPCVISLNLQPDIRPDEYTILITAQDKIGDQAAESKHTFRVE